MKRRKNIPTRSMGAEENDPALAELSEWVQKRKGTACDLISFKLERSLSFQRQITVPCVGGEFYADRWINAIGGIRDRILVTEPHIVPESVKEDAKRISAFRRGVWVSVPAPSAIGIKNSYSRNESEFLEGICETYLQLMREMRDAGVGGHVLQGDWLSEIELEELAGKKTFFFASLGNAEVLSSILEVQDTAAVYADQFSLVSGLLEEYDIRKIVLIDPEPVDLERAIQDFDTQNLTVGGYCRTSCEKYWTALAESSFVLI